MNENILNIGLYAKKAAKNAASLPSGVRDAVLLAAADALEKDSEHILSQNAVDCENAVKNGMKKSLYDRLALNPDRIRAMADGIRGVAAQPDPIGEIISASNRPNGLRIQNIRVPLGVVAMIYEARPHVTADAFAIALKAGNAAILRGGSDAICSNTAISEAIRRSILTNPHADVNIVQLVADTSRESALALMKLSGYVDALVPRGGAGLIRTCVENSTIPVIETGVGNCHVYADESADFGMASRIVFNAKTNRPGVCNAAETLLVHKNIAEGWLPVIGAELAAHGVEIRGDERTLQILGFGTPATDSDWDEEYLDDILAVKVVDSIHEALAHIDAHSTRHSEAIVTSDYANARMFCDRVDAAAVYVNASTRFTDGGIFGLGAELGISTQKLHARGPLGARELTSNKFVILGNGEIRQ
jgi:glutamate-5-semialdehyde dehydrogenase